MTLTAPRMPGFRIGRIPLGQGSPHPRSKPAPEFCGVLSDVAYIAGCTFESAEREELRGLLEELLA